MLGIQKDSMYSSIAQIKLILLYYVEVCSLCEKQFDFLDILPKYYKLFDKIIKSFFGIKGT